MNPVLPSPVPTAMEKVRALRKLGSMLGMWGSRRRVEPIKADGAFLFLALQVALDHEAQPASRAAAASLMDFFRPDWRSALPPELIGYAIERGDVSVAAWRRRVLARDGFTCQGCGKTENLHVHHLARWADCPELRVADDNGRTLCVTCHIRAHSSDAALRPH